MGKFKKFERKPPKTVKNLKDLLKTSAKMFGDKVLYEYKESKENKTYSYAAFAEDTDALGTSFCARGLAGKTIAVIGDTHPYWVMTYLAAVNSNSIIVPLDRELSLDAICDFINLSECSAVAYTGAFDGKLISVSERIPGVSLFIALGANSDDCKAELPGNAQVVSISELINEGHALIDSGNTSYTELTPDIEKCCAILFTSGTTGTSKGVMLSQKNITASVNAASLAVVYDDTTRLVSLLPIHHTYELTCTHLGGINLGCSIYINPSLKYAARSLAYYKPDAIVVVPMFLETIYKKIQSTLDEKKIRGKVTAAMKLSNALLALNIDLRRKLFKDILAAFGGNVQTVICGGAPIQSGILKDLYTFGLTVFEGYGITECSPLVAVNPNGAPKFGSVGTAVAGTSVKIGDAGDDGRGEILVKGDNVMLGYFKNKEATESVFDSDGWFKTGDIGYIDNDGYIFITGRKKNVIILSNGKNVYPEEIEEHLSYSKYVKEIVVIGRADEKSGKTSIVAVVYPDFDSFPGLSSQEVKDAALKSLENINETLPAFKQVSVFEFRDTEFEKTTTKKIKRFLVK